MLWCVCMFILNFYRIQKNVYESVTNNCTKYERVWFSYRGTFLMHIKVKMIYNNYHYLELCVIIHAWLLLVEVFFRGVHLECEKKPYSYNSFYRLFVSKIFTPFFQLIPSHIKSNACSFTDENVSRFFWDNGPNKDVFIIYQSWRRINIPVIY